MPEDQLLRIFLPLLQVARLHYNRFSISCPNCLLQALAYCHSNGVVHRDVKPLNIFLSRNGGVKLGDFGVSKLAGATDAMTTFVGTPLYAHPSITTNIGLYHSR